MRKATVEKVVLIDDSEIDLFIQKRFLEVYNFSTELRMFTSANEALEALKNDEGPPPEVIFLDLNMPDADGFTFLKEFKTIPAAVSRRSRIVVLTSSDSIVDRDYVLSFKSVVHFITKPLKHTDIEDLKILFL